VRFNAERKALNSNLYQFTKIRFTEDIDGIFEDKLQKWKTGHFTEKHLGNMKHRPKAWKLQTEARAYGRERDRCGWTGRLSKPGRPDTRTHRSTRLISS